MRLRTVLHAIVVVAVLGAAASAADWGLKDGTPDIKSAGPLAFGPDGIVLVGDTKSAAVFAIATGDTSGDPNAAKFEVEGLGAKVAELLGTSSAAQINDLAVNPASGNVYLSVSRGAEGTPAVVRVESGGKLSQVSLEKASFSKVVLPDAPAASSGKRRNPRAESVTDLAFVDGKVVVSGRSSAASPSTVREIPFPFSEANPGTSLEIYHGAHGRLEDSAVVRTFVPFNIGDEPSLLAGFTCTPLVKFPVASLVPGKKVRGTTVAELGNRNKPLDMIVYEQNGKRFLLIANSSRGVMKVSTEGIDRTEGITERVSGGGTAGQTYETIESLKGVVQLDRLNAKQAVVIVRASNGAQNLRTVALP